MRQASTSTGTKPVPTNVDDDDAEIPDIISPKRPALTNPRKPRPIIPPAIQKPAAPNAGPSTATQPAKAAATAVPVTKAPPKAETLPALIPSAAQGKLTVAPADLRACFTFISEAAVRVTSSGNIEIGSSDRDASLFGEVVIFAGKRQGAKAEASLHGHGFSVPKKQTSALAKLLKQHGDDDTISLSIAPVAGKDKLVNVAFEGEDFVYEGKALLAEKKPQENISKADSATSFKVSAGALSSVLQQLGQFGESVDISFEDKDMVATVNGTTLKITGTDFRSGKSAGGAKGLPVLNLLSGLKLGLYFDKSECLLSCGPEIPGVVVRFEGTDISISFLVKEAKKKN